MGVGEDAGKVAGFTYNEGRLYYLFVKEALMHSGGDAGQPPEGEPVQ